MVGLAGTALSIGFAGLAPTVAVLAVCLVLLGTFNGGANAAIGPLFVIRLADADRGKVLAAINGVSRAGSILALALGALVGSWLGARATFVGGGICALLVVAALAWWLRDVDRTPPIHEDVLASAPCQRDQVLGHPVLPLPCSFPTAEMPMRNRRLNVSERIDAWDKQGSVQVP